MAKKINRPKTNLEIIQSIRNDWGDVKPYTRVFDDERKQIEREKKHKKNLAQYEQELEGEDSEY